MNEFEKIFDKLKTLLYESKAFTAALCVLMFIITAAFPQFMLLVVTTTVVFVFIKGCILLIEMINDK